MIVDLDREGLIALVRGSSPSYANFKNSLVIKGGHTYCDNYGWTTWSKLSSLTDDELWKLFNVCKHENYVG